MTQMLIDLSNALRRFSFVFVIVIVGAVMLFKRYRKTPNGSLKIRSSVIKTADFWRDDFQSDGQPFLPHVFDTHAKWSPYSGIS